MVATKGMKYPDRELYEWVLNELHKRNITNQTIGEIAYHMQHQYLPDLTVEDFGKELDEVLKKREVLNILAVGFTLDNLTDEKKLPEPLQIIIENDLGTFGGDESWALALSQLYGSIAVTNYGFTDKDKPGVARVLDNNHGHVNTFADDLALALASAVIGRCGHGSKLQLDDEPEENNQEDATTPDEQNYHISTGIKQQARKALYSLADFAYYINEVLYYNDDAKRLIDLLEQEWGHDYYIEASLHIPESVDSSYILFEFYDNANHEEFETTLPLKKFYEFCLSYADGHNDYLFNSSSDISPTHMDWLATFVGMYQDEIGMEFTRIKQESSSTEDETHEEKQENDREEQNIDDVYEKMRNILREMMKDYLFGDRD